MIPRGGCYVWVWQDSPVTLPAGCVGPVVRAANGDSTVSDTGFDFAANYARWTDRYPNADAWTYLYPGTDGRLAAEALHGSAPGASSYLIDVEDPVPPGVISAFCSRLRELAPGTPIGYSSYATKGQGINHGVPWDALEVYCDFASPQVYYPYQGAAIAEVRDSTRHPLAMSFSPRDWEGFGPTAADARGRGEAVIIWRLPSPYVTAADVAATSPSTPPPPAPPAPSWTEQLVQNLPTLKQGSTGAGVRNVQGLLSAHGFTLTIDGSFGPRTDQAARHFQSGSGLGVDGIVGRQTWTCLLGVA